MGITPSCQFCCGVVALEEQSLSCYNSNCFSHQKSWIFTSFPSSRWFLPEVYPVWSPAKFFSSGSLWPIRQGFQITHIWKSHPCFPWECTAYKYLVLTHIFHLLLPIQNSQEKECKFVVWLCSCLLQGFLSYWKSELLSLSYRNKKIQDKLILLVGKLYLGLSKCMKWELSISLL